CPGCRDCHRLHHYSHCWECFRCSVWFSSHYAAGNDVDLISEVEVRVVLSSKSVNATFGFGDCAHFRDDHDRNCGHDERPHHRHQQIHHWLDAKVGSESEKLC